MSLLAHRTILVTGKGGVGKSTVAAALGLEAGAQGKKTLVAEISGAQRMAELFRRPSIGYEPDRVARNLWAISISPEAAIEDYVVQQIKFRRLYRLVFRNRVMAPFVEAVPGLHDAIQLGKIFDLDQETTPDGRPVWDLIIVDAPATGHGLTMLHSARSMMELTRAGPLFDGVRRVHEVIDDPRATAIVLVSTPEELPVNETIDLWTRLGPNRNQVRMCVLNEVLPDPFPDRAGWEVARPLLLRSPSPAVREAVSLAQTWARRVDRQAAYRARLCHRLPVPIVDLPFLFHRDLGASELSLLGRRLCGGAPLSEDSAGAPP